MTDAIAALEDPSPEMVSDLATLLLNSAHAASSPEARAHDICQHLGDYLRDTESLRKSVEAQELLTLMAECNEGRTIVSGSDGRVYVSRATAIQFALELAARKVAP